MHEHRCDGSLHENLHGVLSKGLLGDGDGVERSGTVFDVSDSVGTLNDVLGRGDLVEEVRVANAWLRKTFVFERSSGTSLVALVASWILGVLTVCYGW